MKKKHRSEGFGEAKDSREKAVVSRRGRRERRERRERRDRISSSEQEKDLF